MSAPFYEVRFPEHVSAGAEAVVRSKTSVVTAGGGKESRNREWSSQLREWDAARGIRYTSDLENVRAFHIVMGGRHAGFRFKDFSDWRAEAQALDTSGGSAPVQLRKGYAAGDVTKWRALRKPVPGTTRLQWNGEECVVLEDGQGIGDWLMVFGEWEFGTNPEVAPRFTLDTTTGLLTPVGLTLAEEDSLMSWCDFDCPARFGSDELRVRAVARGKIWEYPPIPVKEIRL